MSNKKWLYFQSKDTKHMIIGMAFVYQCPLDEVIEHIRNMTEGSVDEFESSLRWLKDRGDKVISNLETKKVRL